MVPWGSSVTTAVPSVTVAMEVPSAAGIDWKKLPVGVVVFTSSRLPGLIDPPTTGFPQEWASS
jgi:hypothetical protein